MTLTEARNDPEYLKETIRMQDERIRELERSLSFLDQLKGTVEKLVKERDEAQAKLRESEAKCAAKDKALRAFVEAEEDWRKHGLPVDIDDLLSDAYQEALKALSLDFGKTIPQVLCHECGITSRAQMEVVGPTAYEPGAPRKYFCSMRCFDGWMRHYQDDLDEYRAAQLPSQAPTD